MESHELQRDMPQTDSLEEISSCLREVTEYSDAEALWKSVVHLDEKDQLTVLGDAAGKLNMVKEKLKAATEGNKEAFLFVENVIKTLGLKDKAFSQQPDVFAHVQEGAMPKVRRRDKLVENRRMMVDAWGDDYNEDDWCEPHVTKSRTSGQALTTLTHTCQRHELSYRIMKAYIRIAVYMRLQKPKRGVSNTSMALPSDIKQAIVLIKEGIHESVPTEAIRETGFGVNDQGFLCIDTGKGDEMTE